MPRASSTPLFDPRGEPPRDEDDLDPLPPLDGDGSDEEPPPADDLDVAETKEDLDDAAAEDPLADDAVDAEERTWLDDADAAEDLDLGAAEVFEERELLHGADEPGLPEEELDVGEEAALGEDVGEEGPEAPDDDLREEDLPALDADEEGTPDEELLFDRRAMAEDFEPRRADRAWLVRAVEPAVTPVRAIAPRVGGALVGGAGLALVDAAGGARALSGVSDDVMSLAWCGGAWLAALESGVVLGAEGGASVRRSAGSPRAARLFEVASGVCAIDVDGGVYFSPDGLEWLGPTRSAVCGGVDGAGELVVLARAHGAMELSRGGTTVTVPVLARVVEIAARGAEVAVRTEGSGGAVHRLAHGAWAAVPGTEGATALAFVDDAGTLLCCVPSPSEDATRVIRAPVDADASIVADVGTEDAPVARALAWDDAARLAWVGGDFGVCVVEAPGAGPRAAKRGGEGGRSA